MTLKDRFENYEMESDAKVWEGVSRSIRQRRLLRNGFYTLGATAVVAASVALFVSRPAADTEAVVTAQLPEAAGPAAVGIADNTISAAAAVDNRISRTDRNEEQVAPSLPSGSVSDQPVAVVDAKLAEEVAVDAAAPVVAAPIEETAVATDRSERAKVGNSTNTSTATAASANEDVVTPKVSALNKDFVDFKSFLPTAISPDNGTNVGVFKVDSRVMDYIQFDNYKMYVYNRGGRMVYHTTSYTEGWNGVFNGVKQPKGNYVYVIEYRDASTGEVKRVQGTFLLVR